ncbi:MAG: hypothetical protein ACOYMN_01025 [Roseimicrobium sp.]
MSAAMQIAAAEIIRDEGDDVGLWLSDERRAKAEEEVWRVVSVKPSPIVPHLNRKRHLRRVAMSSFAPPGKSTSST